MYLASRVLVPSLLLQLLRKWRSRIALPTLRITTRLLSVSVRDWRGGRMNPIRIFDGEIRKTLYGNDWGSGEGYARRMYYEVGYLPTYLGRNLRPGSRNF